MKEWMRHNEKERQGDIKGIGGKTQRGRERGRESVIKNEWVDEAQSRGM